MTISSGPPMGTPATSTTVSSCFTSRETSLYGAVTGMQSATPSISRKWPGSTGPLLPVMPMAVRPAPSMAWGAKPSSRTRASIRFCGCGLMSGARTISIPGWYRRTPHPAASSAPEPFASFQRVAGQPGGRGHALLSFRLHLAQPQDGPISARDVDPRGRRADDFTRSASSGGQGLGRMDLQHGALDLGPEPRPGRETAPAAIELERGPREVGLAVLPPQDRRERRPRVVLGLTRQFAPLEESQGLRQYRSAERAELPEERLSGLVGTD